MADREQENFRDKLSTVDASGKRVWVYPKKPSGPLYQVRTWVGIALLIILFAGPFITIGGEPLLMLNILERKFIIFGQVFWPQDFFIFVLAMIVGVIFIVLFTVVFGRLFCGWVCPQTIFMELVFRRIEYWIEGDYMAQKKLDKQPWNREKIIKKTSKHIIFFAIAFLIGNTFLAYIIGIEELKLIVTDSPSEHMGGLTAMLVFSFAFYFVFASFREQVCTTICPYGRLQGVLLDRQSIVVAYDYQRGEQRGKLRKDEDRAATDKGDCIDCKQCVVVCPTGIDIRNGTQLECINCTACIDACNNIMDKVGFEKGLIRYASEENIAEKKQHHWTTRSIAYTVLLVLLTGVLVSLVWLRTDVETTVLRTPGMLYQDQGDNQISNLYNVKIINKTNRAIPLNLQLEGENGEIRMVGDSLIVEPQSMTESAFFIIMNRDNLEKIKTDMKIDVLSEGEKLETVKTTFLGPG